MANKKEKSKREQEYLVIMNEKAKEKILPFYLIAAGIGIVAVLFYFFNWVYIFNNTAGVGVEVKANGFNFIFAAISGKYSSTSKIYGDIAVPFYYYAANYCKTLGVLTLLSAICLLASIGVSIATYFTKKQELSILSAAFALGATALLVACFIEALSMKNSRILPVYCSGNPRCFIESLAILPAIVAAGLTALQFYAVVKYFKTKSELKA